MAVAVDDFGSVLGHVPAFLLDPVVNWSYSGLDPPAALGSSGMYIDFRGAANTF